MRERYKGYEEIPRQWHTHRVDMCPHGRLPQAGALHVHIVQMQRRARRGIGPMARVIGRPNGTGQQQDCQPEGHHHNQGPHDKGEEDGRDGRNAQHRLLDHA